MATKNDWFAPAFPTDQGGKGMNLRDYVVIHALQGILANASQAINPDINPDEAAKRAINFADALGQELMKERV